MYGGGRQVDIVTHNMIKRDVTESELPVFRAYQIHNKPEIGHNKEYGKSTDLVKACRIAEKRKRGRGDDER